MDRANRAYEALHRLGLTRLSYAASDRQRVLSYHDVLPDGLRRASAADALTVSASVLRRQLQDIARHRRFSHILGEPGTVIVTFDDGNRNNFECARPILAELGIRAYFFVPLETALAGRLAWPSLVALWCERSAPGLKPPGLAEAAIDETPGARERAGAVLFAAASRDRALRRAICAAIEPWQAELQAASEHARLRYSAMSRVELEQLKREGHFIGAHSRSHDVLSALTPEDLRADFDACAAAIGEVYNTDLFCYPFGGPGEVDDAVVAQCRASGFSAAFAHVPTAWAPEWGAFGLPRIPMTEDHGPAAVHARISGLSHFLKRMAREVPRQRVRP
jgi:peptidoglycan/xylan/chitin deacetylase (PgdA/CDA1 family)